MKGAGRGNPGAEAVPTPSANEQGEDQRLALQTAGITLLGVLISIGVTVALGIKTAWWTRIAIGLATTMGLAFAVAILGTRTTVLARLTDWITGRSYREG